MARVEITKDIARPAGTLLTGTAAIADGHKVNFTKRTVFWFVNDDASSKTITLPTPAKFEGLEIADRTITVPAGESRMVRGLNEYYRQSDGTVYINYSATTGVTTYVWE